MDFDLNTLVPLIAGSAAGSGGITFVLLKAYLKNLYDRNNELHEDHKKKYEAIDKVARKMELDLAVLAASVTEIKSSILQLCNQLHFSDRKLDKAWEKIDRGLG